MKRLLLASTVAITASISAQGANAAEPIKLEIGGYMEQYFGGFGTIKHSDNGKARDGFGVDTETRLYVQGSSVLDNGMTVGAFISFIAEANTDDSRRNVEEQWAYLSGDFGALYVGERNGVFDQFAIRAPNVTGRTGQDVMDWVKYYGGAYPGGFIGPGGRAYGSMVPSLETTLDDNALRVSYVTPSFYGFSLGVSFAPNADIGHARGVRVREGREGSNELQAGIAFSRNFGEVDVLADGSFTTTLDGRDRWGYRAGLVLTYGGLSFGGSYMGTTTERRGWTGDVNPFGPSYGNPHAFSENIWEVGAAYEVGPYGLSLTYSQNESDYGDAMTWQLGGAYKLGPGVTAVGQAFYGENNAHDLFDGAKTYRSGVGAISGLILEF